MGVDDGDSDKFKIGTTAIGTSTALTIDGSQNITAGADLTVTGDIVVSATGPHAIGGATVDWAGTRFTGAYTSGGADDSAYGVGFGTNITGAAGDTNRQGIVGIGGGLGGTVTTQGSSQTIGNVASLMLSEPAITVGSGDTVTNASTLYIQSAPTEGTNDYALFVDAGVSRFDGSIDLVGGQITFPATQVPSANANTLDDYEEGSWTPVLGGSGGTSGQGYTDILDGRYVKIGKVVTITFHFKMTTEGTITGDCQIQGLPFTARTVGGGAGVCNAGLSWGGTTTSYVNIRSQVASNATVAGVKGLTGAATSDTALTASNVQDNTTMAGMYVYETSA
jgi:hypothetical protein